jgi:hypothetical protein
MFGTFFFFSLYMQLVRGYSALGTGVRILPLTGMIFFVAPQAGRFAQRHGSRYPMTFGPLLAGTGLLLMSRIGVATDYKLIIPILMMMGIGMGSTMAPMTAAVMNAVGPQRAGLGSATTNTSREVGGTFGIALLGTLLTTQLRSRLLASLVFLHLDQTRLAAILGAAQHGTLGPKVLQGLDPATANAVRTAFAQSFMSGFRVALAVAAGFVYLAAILAYRFVPSGAPAHDDEEPELAKKKAPAGAGANGKRRPARSRASVDA